jgi:hypothetical protein
MSLLASRELSAEELDALEAEAAPAAPLAMGPVQELDPAREYSPEELELYQQATELSPDDLDEQLVTSVFDDPTYIPTREEFLAARETKARLKSEGKLPGLLENAATGAKGFIQTLGDMANEILDDPGDFLARGPATGQAIAKKSWRNTNDVARWLRTSMRPDVVGRDESTGEFVTGYMHGLGASEEVRKAIDADVLTAAQAKAQAEGRKIRPVTEDDLNDYDYENFLFERTRQKELEEWVTATTARTHPLHRALTGRDQMEEPMQATSDVAGGLIEATNVATMGIPFSAGATKLGLSNLAKTAGSRGARIMERAAGGGIQAMETGAARFQDLLQRTTRITPENQVKIAKWSAAGGLGGAAFGFESSMPGVSQAQDAAKYVGGAYLLYKGGLGTLRTVQKVAGPTSTILRVAADPADGLDAVAQASVASKLGAFPELAPVREVLENPSKFRAIESTPARLAADPRLGPQSRAIMEGLANPLVVQGVRGASAVASGAAKGAAANTPFVALALNAEEEQAAGNMLGIGAAFGAIGGAYNRVGGMRQRRAEARASDIGRMFLDVELAGGDVAGLAKTYSPDQLGDLASMQGIFRNSVEFVPLNLADYDLNVQANGGAGSAGMFIQAPPGEKARVFVNLDAKRDGVVPHEFGHALLQSGALGSTQAAEIRANVNRRYTQAGVEARATEYARNLLAAQNEKAFPGQNIPVTPDAIATKLDELGQSGLMRGDLDTLDWARDELFAEEFRTASANLDFSAIRRGLPADGSWLGSFEKILGGHANALSISGVRIDPATGAPIDTPQSLFRDNPVLAADKTLLKNLDTYIRNYRQWVNHPEQSKPRGVRVAPTARPQDLANNPQITFHDLGNGTRGNEFATIDPATGQPILRDQRVINAEQAKRQQQIRSLIGNRLLPVTDPTLGPKKTTDGRVTVRGRVLPQQFDFLNGFAQHIRGFAREFEGATSTPTSRTTASGSTTPSSPNPAASESLPQPVRKTSPTIPKSPSTTSATAPAETNSPPSTPPPASPSSATSASSTPSKPNASSKSAPSSATGSSPSPIPPSAPKKPPTAASPSAAAFFPSSSISSTDSPSTSAASPASSRTPPPAASPCRSATTPSAPATPEPSAQKTSATSKPSPAKSSPGAGNSPAKATSWPPCSTSPNSATAPSAPSTTATLKCNSSSATTWRKSKPPSSSGWTTTAPTSPATPKSAAKNATPSTPSSASPPPPTEPPTPSPEKSAAPAAPSNNSASTA